MISDVMGRIKQKSLARLGYGPLDLLVVQPTPYCNLACRYCYLPDKDDRSILSEEMLEKILKWVKASGLVSEVRPFTLVWHAGEPLVAGIDWYRMALRKTREQFGDLRIPHGIQTNGTLINEDWCLFFKENPEISVGVSVDGPEAYHDLNRRTRSGRGSFRQTLRGIEHLHRHAIPFHVICVLTEASLRDPDALFDFFRAQGIRSVGFNVEEKEGVHTQSSLSEASSADYGSFLKRFLGRLDECPEMSVRELNSALFGSIVEPLGQTRAGPQMSSPFRILTVSYRGELSTFCPELLGQASAQYNNFVLGHVQKDTFADVLRNPVFTRLHEDISRGIEACRESCGFFGSCGGGAPSNKFFENGRMDSSETMACRLRHQTSMSTIAGMIGEGKLDIKNLLSCGGRGESLHG